MTRSVFVSFARPCAPTRLALRSPPRAWRMVSLSLRGRGRPFENFTTRARRRRRARGEDSPEADGEDDEEETVVEVTPTEPTAAKTPPVNPNPPVENPAPSPSQSEGDDTDEAIAPWKEDRAGDIRSLKASLLSEVAGFDRGFVAVARDTAKIRSIVESLETLSGSIDLTAESPGAQETFDGSWKLVFSSAFNAGSRRNVLPPLPPLFVIGPVFQVIDTEKKELDNVLELLQRNAQRFPWAPSNAVPKLRVAIKHDMSYNMSIVSLKQKETSINVLDTGFDLPMVTIPSITALVRSLAGRKSDGEFSLVYLDDDLRITEGDRSELRIFVKVPGLE